MGTTTKRYIGLDVSLSAPGIAIIDVKWPNGVAQPTLVTARHVKTNARQPHGLRYAIIESFITVVAAEYRPVDGYAAIIREDYTNGRNKNAVRAIFGAWAAVDSGLNRHGLAVTDAVTPLTVKKLIGGHGKADKDEVAAGVRRLLRLGDDFTFKTDDESDAAAVALAWLAQTGVIKIAKE